MSRFITPIQRVRCRGHEIHVKRDDLHSLSGNKFRKLFWLLEKEDEFFQDKHILSYGGLQSNAMLAVAQLAQLKKAPFTYFTKHIPQDQFERIQGLKTNFSAATELGMKHIEIRDDQYEELVDTHSFEPLVPLLSQQMKIWLGVPQGVAVPEAEHGVRQLALELNTFAQYYDYQVAVVIPCGTGTTAHFVSQHVHPDVQVYGVPCVGGSKYLESQIARLGSSSNSKGHGSLKILVPKKRVAFGAPWRPLAALHYEILEATGIEIDLIYGCYAWHTMLHALDSQVFGARQVIYVHSGGNTGNPSQLARYKSRYGDTFLS